MALGTNRDYVKTHRATLKELKKNGFIRLWECPKCNRKNLNKEKECPRCKEPRGDAELKVQK